MPDNETLWSPAAVRPVAGAGFCLFALAGTDHLGEAVSALLGAPLTAHEERDFEDGEHKARPLGPVAGRDVYVLHSLNGSSGRSANDKLCRLLFFIGAVKDAGAARVTAVVPYLCYARKDRRTKPNDPVTTRYVGALFEAVGTDAVVTLEVHNDAAFENAFRCRTVALSAAPLLIERIRAVVGTEPLCVVSPDLGGGKRAELLREALERQTGQRIGRAFAEKHRSAGTVSGDLFVGEVEGRTCIIVDDLVSTGGTLLRAATAARKAGARRVIACAAHGLFSAGAEQVLADPAIERFIVTDTAAPFRLPDGICRDKLDIVPAAPLLAEAIRRLHENEPFADLLAS
ncbi:ribose-phosphate diphosphokinase [Labrys monachus]|uniref:ribose-phosphate diphosphokinase n=1 Tax=Labrys monachus TaxID=217067 RepID=A0ABU0F6V4_9HYPH|nr:ribose-phosphate diphosphokinase [Labrys monachus]MDQ0390291.1 ribose-phosphate pyrophosphokinase [Labrys monachus]